MPDGFFEDCQTFIDFCWRVMHSGGEMRMTLLPQPSRSRPRSKARSTTRSRRLVGGFFASGAVLDKLNADHQADPAHLADAGMAGRHLVQRIPGRNSPTRRRFPCIRSRSGRWSPGPPRRPAGCRRRCCRARPCGQVIDALAGDHGAQRHAGGNALGGADDIRLDAKVFDRPPLAGAAHAGLDFVGDQQDAVPVAQFAQGREETRRRGRCSRLHPGSVRPGCRPLPRQGRSCRGFPLRYSARPFRRNLRRGRLCRIGR